MDWAQIGEFGLIDRIGRIAGEPRHPVLVGIGDDAAVVAASPDVLVLVSTDAMVEGRHFRRQWMAPHQIGARAAAATLSDIAAMGGTATGLLCTLCVCPTWTLQEVQGLVQGIHDLGQRFGVTLAGGDVVAVTNAPAENACHALVVDMVALGQAEKSRLWLRSGAREGDRVLVTGTLGEAAAAIALLEAPQPTPRERFHLLFERLTSPLPRLEAAATLAPLEAVHSAIDISDGLLQDAGHIADASGVAIELCAADIPVNRQLLDCAELLGRDPLQWAVAGGEDFELLLTASPERVPDMQDALVSASITLTDVGRVVAGSGVRLLDAEDAQLHFDETGWDHFSTSGSSELS